MIKEIYLRNFRNIENAYLKFSPRMNIFIGDNGQGKTNILEAINLTLTGDSFRQYEIENFILNSKNESMLKGQLDSSSLDFAVEINILNLKKNIKINNKKSSSGELNKKFQSVTFSPESLSFIKDSSEKRRNLIDEFLISVNLNNIQLIADFKKCLKTRNKILKDNLENNNSNLKDLLDSINPAFLSLSAKLTYERIRAIKSIYADLNLAMKKISQENVDIAVEYIISGIDSMEFELSELENAMRKRQKELEVAEIASGSSLFGPQRHDIRFLYNQKDSRFYCSQGQQRALILSFKMAQIVYHGRVNGTYPVLMLDDVLSELDIKKRERLISFLVSLDAQIFITTTDLNLPSEITHGIGAELCSLFHIQRGQVL